MNPIQIELLKEKQDKRVQRGLWQRRHKLNIVERELLVSLNRKYGTYTGPKVRTK